MSFQLRPPSTPRPRPTPPRSEGGGAFAVGSKVLTTPTSTNQRGVELSDENGTPLGVRLALDLPVTITAWRPRRGAPARYRVGSADGVEGWLDAADLRRIPPPPPPPPPIATAAPAPPVKAAPKGPLKATLKAAPPRPATKVPAPAATKPVKPAKVVKAAVKAKKPAAPAPRKAAARKPERSSARRTRRR